VLEKHVTILGVLYIALGCLGVLGALVVFTAVTGGGLLSGDETAILVTGAVGTAIASFLLLLSLPMVIGGIALLRHARWARIFVLVLGALNLLNIPFGTLLGIYTLWALTRPEIESMFNQPVAVARV
jgi:hypothetical protein